jgi:hypothetical protein
MRRIIFALVAALCLTIRAISAPPSPSEYEVKAAFLYNLAKFIDWPSGALPASDTQLRIGILGDSPMFEAISQLGDKTIGERKLEVRRVTPESKLDEYHIIFLDQTVKNADQLAFNLRGSKTLTVGETEAFCRDGGLVNFILINNRVGFEINQKAAERAGFIISSKLLNLARITSDEKK